MWRDKVYGWYEDNVMGTWLGQYRLAKTMGRWLFRVLFERERARAVSNKLAEPTETLRNDADCRRIVDSRIDHGIVPYERLPAITVLELNSGELYPVIVTVQDRFARWYLVNCWSHSQDQVMELGEAVAAASARSNWMTRLMPYPSMLEELEQGKHQPPIYQLSVHILIATEPVKPAFAGRNA